MAPDQKYIGHDHCSGDESGYERFRCARAHEAVRCERECAEGSEHHGRTSQHVQKRGRRRHDRATESSNIIVRERQDDQSADDVRDFDRDTGQRDPKRPLCFESSRDALSRHAQRLPPAVSRSNRWDCDPERSRRSALRLSRELPWHNDSTDRRSPWTRLDRTPIRFASGTTRQE